jgi:putative acetyltransferase
MLSGPDVVADAAVRCEVLTLTPLAVTPEYERRGIGSALVRAASEEAERRDEPLVVLQGSPRYYGRLGLRFAPAHGISIDLPDWRREARRCTCCPHDDPCIRGRVEYPPETAAVTE